MPRHRMSSENYEVSGTVWLVTMATHNRIPILNDQTVARSVVDAITFKCRQTDSNPLVWCLMPDHVHLLIEIGEANLIKMIGEIKSFTGREYARKTEATLWQPSFHDRGVRSTEPLSTAAAYVVNNPVRAGLVETWEEWPWIGGLLIEAGEISDRPM